MKAAYITTNSKNEVIRKSADMTPVPGSKTGWIEMEPTDGYYKVYGQIGIVKIVLGTTSNVIPDLGTQIDSICVDFPAWVSEKMRTGQFVRMDWIEALRANGWPWEEADRYRTEWYARKERERA
jgi:hypothetical protein